MYGQVLAVDLDDPGLGKNNIGKHPPVRPGKEGRG